MPTDDGDTSLSLSRRDLIQASVGALAAAVTLAPAVAPSIAQAGGAAPPSVRTTPEDYILRRLKQYGAAKIFGVPGKTCENIYDRAEANGVGIVLTSSDLEAGYAADGYARAAGLGATAVTYGVGTLSLINAVGAAYTERSPLVVINGGPSADDLKLQLEQRISFSHSIGRRRHDGGTLTTDDLLTDLAAFKTVTAYARRADTTQSVPKIVDDAIVTALTLKRPVYIEIAKHIWGQRFDASFTPLAVTPQPAGAEAAAAEAIVAKLRAARTPIVMLGIEVQRYGLADATVQLITKLGLPWTTTLLAKAVIPEATPGFFGVYDGAYAPPVVKQIIAGADVLLAIGCMFGVQYKPMLTRGGLTAIRVAEGEMRVSGDAAVRKVELGTLLQNLNARTIAPGPNWQQRPKLAGLSFDQRRASHSASPPANPTEPGISYDSAMRRMSDALDESLLTITDTSLSMYPAADLDIRGRGGFACSSLWQSIGYSAGSALGFALAPNARRPLVICGDGGLQMTIQALSTIARLNVPAIFVVLDNGIYGIEQWLIDLADPGNAYHGDPSRPALPFLKLQPWAYEQIAIAMGFEAANVRKVATDADFASAFAAAKAATKPFFIRALVKPHDLPGELRPT